MENKINNLVDFASLQSEINELDKQIETLANDNASDKLVGALELKLMDKKAILDRAKKVAEFNKKNDEAKAPKENSEPETPLTTKEKLMVLVKNRINTQRQTYFNIEKLSAEEQKMVARQHELMILLDTKAKSATEEDKKRYSSESKRKFEYQVLLSNDDQVKELFEAIQVLKKDQVKLEYIDKIQKIDEKYLFKLIDLELASKDN